MSKLNFYFNGTEYSVDESDVSSAKASLKEHLGTDLNGSGATIKFDGASYNVDSTKLSAAVTNFVRHLGLINGNGIKVVIGGTEYSVDSTKLAATISGMHSAFSGLQGGGEVSYWQQVKNACDAGTADQMLSVGDVIEDTYRDRPIELRVVDLAPNQVIVQPVTYTEKTSLGDNFCGYDYGQVETDLPVGTSIMVWYGYEIYVVTLTKSVPAGSSICYITYTDGEGYGYYGDTGLWVNGKSFSDYTAETFYSFEEAQSAYPENVIVLGSEGDCGSFLFTDYRLPAEYSNLEYFSPEFAQVCSTTRAPSPKDIDKVYQYGDDYSFNERDPLDYYRRTDVSEENWGSDAEPVDWGDTFWLYDEASQTYTIPVSSSNGDGPNGGWGGVYTDSCDIWEYCGIRNLYIIKGDPTQGDEPKEEEPEELVPSEGLAFTSNGDGTCYVSGIGECTDTDIVIPSKSPAGDTVITIDKNAFSHSYTFPQQVTSIVIPDSVTSIPADAFNHCVYLESITIPNSVTSIGSSAFNNCALESIVLPVGITVISDYLFTDCSGLSSIMIPDGVHTIGDCAFEGCRKLSSITIPASVDSIGTSVFYWCESLTDVYYNGSAEEWAQISIGDYNECLTNATIHYNA